VQSGSKPVVYLHYSQKIVKKVRIHLDKQEEKTKLKEVYAL